MYGNHWYVAGGKTFSANYLKDAGADYIFKENQDKKVLVGFNGIDGKEVTISE